MRGRLNVAVERCPRDILDLRLDRIEKARAVTFQESDGNAVAIMEDEEVFAYRSSGTPGSTAPESCIGAWGWSWPSKKSPFARERRLRRLAVERGFALVSVWGGDRRQIGGLGTCYLLVPHHSGLSLDEVEELLRRSWRQYH
jgi:hypothetical protein